MNLKISPIMMVLLLSFGVSSINFSLAEENIAGMNNEVTNVSENEVVEETEALDTVIINDPVATYNGIPISKEAFLDYMEGQTGMRSDTFYDEGSVETALQIYLLQKYKMEQAEKLGLTTQSKNALEVKFIKQSILTQIVLSKNLISEEELELKKGSVELPNSEILKVFASVYYPSVNFDEVKSNPELEKVIQDNYKTESILLPLAETAQLDQDRQFQIVYEGIILNLWSRKYDDYYIEHLPEPTKEELRESFNEWLKSQDFNRYKIAHIYLKDIEQAKELLEQIRDGEITFEDAAKKNSLDNNSKKYGGKIQQGQWVTFLNPMMPLAKVARNIKPGELYSEVMEGINDGYYHIVYLEDVEENHTPEDYLKNDVLKQRIWEEAKLEEKNSDITSYYNIKINQ